MSVCAIALAPANADQKANLSHLSLFPTLPMLPLVDRYLPSVLSANATQITISLSILVPATALSQNVRVL